MIDSYTDTADGNKRRPVVYLPGSEEIAPTAAFPDEGRRPRPFISDPNNVLSHDMNSNWECV